MSYATRAREIPPSAKAAALAKGSSRGSRASNSDLFEQKAIGSNNPGGERREWSLANMTIGSSSRPPPARSGSRDFQTFPHQARIEQSLGIRIPGRSMVDPEGCDRRHVPAFTCDRFAHFANDRPSLRVAAREAAHLAQLAGRTNEAGLGPEGHASAVAHLIADGTSNLIGPTGAAVQSGVRPYTEVAVAAQSASEWNAKLALRLADNGRMAVGQDSSMHSFWAESSLISASNTTLSSRDSGGPPVPGHFMWNFHWAGVVMNSGDDRVTLENYSVSDSAVQNGDWQFQMYGSAADVSRAAQGDRPTRRCFDVDKGRETVMPDVSKYPRCETLRDVKSCSGWRVILAGTYHLVDLRMRQNPPPARGVVSMILRQAADHRAQAALAVEARRRA
jgi:hypothetical protein